MKIVTRTTKQALFGATPAAYTQTYSAASRTHGNLTSATLTNSTGATANTTVENVPAATASGVDTGAASLASTNTALTAVENNISDLTAQVNALRVDIVNAKDVLNQVLDDLQTAGLLQ